MCAGLEQLELNFVSIILYLLRCADDLSRFRFHFLFLTEGVNSTPTLRFHERLTTCTKTIMFKRRLNCCPNFICFGRSMQAGDDFRVKVFHALQSRRSV